MNPDEQPFPLAQWFDLSGRIARDDRELAEAQISLYSIKDGGEPDSEAVRTCCRQLRAAVREHNAQFKQPPTPRKYTRKKRRKRNTQPDTGNHR